MTHPRDPLARMCAIVVAAAATLLFSRCALADPIRLLVAAGSSSGTAAEERLRYPTDDARNVRDVMTSLGGVRPEHAFVLSDPSPEALVATLNRVRVIASQYRPDDVTLVFYFSGHGDRDALHLGGGTMRLADLASRLGEVPAALKIAVVDACRNLPGRPKGVSAEPAFALSLTAPTAHGAVWLHASADGEAAQESDELGGAVFTHYWVMGLRGAADGNGDGRVTLSESYDFAYGQTLFRSARGVAQIQRPAASFAVREAQPVVLTTTGATSALVLPQSADAHYLIYALGARTLVGEAWGDPSRGVTVALPPGRYVVHRRGAGGSAALEVAIGPRERRPLSTGEFRPFEGEILARKGGELIVRPDELAVGLALRGGGLYAFGQELRWRYAHRFGHWAISAGTQLGTGTDATPAEDVRVFWFGAGARLELRAPLGPFELGAGAGPLAQLVAQRLVRGDAVRAAAAGYSVRQDFHAVGIGGDMAAWTRVALGRAAELALEMDGAMLLARAPSGTRPYFSGGIGAAVVMPF